MMKIALVHELLTMRGGAERVLRILAGMYPNAPIYTPLYDEKKLGDWFPKERVRPSTLQPHKQLAVGSWQFNHHLYLKKMPAAVEAWDFSEFDVVLSTSSGFTHGIITNGNPKHISYINAPARYLWDRTHDVIERASKGILGPLKKRYLEHTFHTLRTWDSEAAARPNKLLAASKDVQRRIELYWRRESEVVYPPIDDYWLEASTRVLEYSSTRNYFLIVSTLVPYKCIDIAIEACNNLEIDLHIVGEGPDRKRLEHMAGKTITFHGYNARDQLKDIYTNAEALIIPGEEDFGLTPLEAMACGTPVISYRAGGPLETITEGETGCFFDEQTAQSLQEILKRFDRSAFASDSCRKRAQEFSRERFEASMRKTIDNIAL